MSYPLKTPVLLLIFNRPDTTLQVLEAIKQVKPTQLFIAADGPRPSRPDDMEKCRKVREIVSRIDWVCEVKTLFREENLGCGKAVSQAINWFFEQTEQGIILEDDTVPNESFFHYCELLLEEYKNHEQIMHISGSRLIAETPSLNTYHFSKYPHVWGWATWRRAWQFYDVEIKKWKTQQPELIKNKIYNSKKEEKVWTAFFQAMQDGKVDTWDTQWNLAIWLEKGLCITPPVNLVTNIGWGLSDATHTLSDDGSLSLPSEKLDLNTLLKPDVIEVNQQTDDYLFNNVYYHWRIRFSLKQYLHDHLYRYLPENIKTSYRRLKTC